MSFKGIKNFIGHIACVFGFHRIKSRGFDGMSIHAYCERCGKQGMIDSQGNLF